MPTPELPTPEAPLSTDLQTQALYDAWKAQPSPETMGPIIKHFEPLIGSQVQQYKGTLPPSALQAHAKKFAVEAIRGYDPTKGAKLSTHVVNNLLQLHRKNYEAQSALRLSEELQRAMGTYRQVRQQLEDEFGREPTAEELSDSLSWPVPKVERLERQNRGEVTFDDLLFEPADPEQRPSDPRIDYVYHDLSPQDKLLMEWTTGYGGKKTMSKKEIAKKLRVSPAAVSQRSLKIAQRLKEALKL